MTSNREIPWWNFKLDKLRSKTRIMFNQAKKTKNWDPYLKKLTDYNKEIRKAKRTSWRKFCEDVTNTTQGARLHKVMSKAEPNVLGLLKRPDGSFTSNEKETLELLVSTHFPGAVSSHLGVAQASTQYRPRNEDWCMAARVIRPAQVKWAVNSFNLYKSCGEDGIIPVLLRKGIGILLPHLIKIFRASYAWGYVPELWTKVKVLFIPKAGRKDRSNPKSFRPISLTSFMLKTMEKVIDRYIRDSVLLERPIHRSQHAYCRGKSTETALLQLVDRVEKALEDKEIALCAFLDIEGAFDNTPIKTLVKGLAEKSVDPTTIRWVGTMLSNRNVRLRLNDDSLEVIATRGCPQGGVISPLLWTLAVDQLLHKMDELRIDTQGYADDLVITIRGNSQSTISYLMQLALNTISKWCQDNELSVNADKTVVVPFTRKRKLNGLVNPRLKGKTIPFSTEVRYLGLTLDQKLTWNNHVERTLQKAKLTLSICNRLAGQRWGLKPKIALWLYTAIVRPKISYASVAWSRKFSQSTVITKLSSLQRTACLMITGAMTTTPGAALNAMLNLTPLHLHLQKEAKFCMHRIRAHTRTNWISQSLQSFQGSMLTNPILDMVTDVMLPTHNFHRNFTVEFPSREEWLNNLITWKTGSQKWYTDGSKSGNNVGCGVNGERPNFKKHVNLGKYASIFQAEVYAIIECAETILRKSYVNQYIYIHSDSQAALSALSSNKIDSRLVDNCLTLLNTLGKRNRVTLRWVPGHAGIEGNELADELARTGAKVKQIGPEPFCGVPKSLVHYVLNNHCTKICTEHWKNTPGLTHSKTLIKAFNKKAANEAVGLSRNNLRTLTRTLTGHCGLNKHMSNLGLRETKVCRLCSQAEETPLHILCDCGPLMRKRSIHLGRQVLSPDEIKQFTAKDILKFLNGIELSSEL